MTHRWAEYIIRPVSHYLYRYSEQLHPESNIGILSILIYVYAKDDHLKIIARCNLKTNIWPPPEKGNERP